MSAAVTLVGLDFGTTTSSAVVARARLARGVVCGRTELSDIQEHFRSDMVFTPLRADDMIDETKVEELLDGWLAAGGVRADEVFGGGALLTGLTARKENAAALVGLVRRRLGDALVATADDPCLESWLAFLGSCAGLSRGRTVLNLDVGGGTTNLALGRDGEVLRTGCLFVGARHVRVEPGTYRIVALSEQARALLTHLGVARSVGDALTPAEVTAVLDFYLSLLEAAVKGDRAPFAQPVARLHEQVAFLPSRDREGAACASPLPRGRGSEGAVVTFSGGVGELVYAHLDGKPWPPTTTFGDLGIDLARRIVVSPVWAHHLHQARPASAGRATVYGLLRHSTEVSGSTLYLPRPDVLPLADVPILGRLDAATPDDEARGLLDLVWRSGRGGCLRVALDGRDAAAVRRLGRKIAGLLRERASPPGRPLVLLMRENLGKALGNYATEWGAVQAEVIVIDEVSDRDARFVRVGAPRQHVVPVSFYGLLERGETL